MNWRPCCDRAHHCYQSLVILAETDDKKRAGYEREEFSGDEEERDLKSKRNEVRRKRQQQ